MQNPGAGYYFQFDSVNATDTGTGRAVQIALPAAETNAEYEVRLMPYAGERMHVDRASRTQTGFVVLTDSPGSSAEFLWTLVRL